MRPSRLFAVVLVAATVAVGATACAAPGDASEDLIRVPQDAATLADAAERIAEGGTILIAAGTYEEELRIDTPDVTVRGEDRNDTVIDGGDRRAYGVVVMADGVTIENLTVTGATFYGVLFTGLHDENGPSAPTASGYERWDPADFPPLQRFLVDHVTAYNNGLYGIYAFNARHGVIRDSYASGSADSGIYVGQCEDCDILVTGNVAERNAVGFENANASDSVVVAGNRFSGNRIGMTLLSSYQEAFTPQRGNIVVGNLVSENAEPDSPAQADGAFATGIGIAGGEANALTRNRIEGHARAGVILTNTEDLPATANTFSENVFAENAVDIANSSAERTPATANCSTDSATALPESLGAQLAAACEGDAGVQATVDTVPGPAAPPGVSYRALEAPPAQPDLPEPTDRGLLPARVAMPDTVSFPVPPADLFAERSGTR